MIVTVTTMSTKTSSDEGQFPCNNNGPVIVIATRCEVLTGVTTDNHDSIAMNQRHIIIYQLFHVRN